jgi:hypothetical protein
MPQSVSDVRSNPQDQIAHAVDVLGRSQQRLAVFKAIYRGKRRAKSVVALAAATGLTPKQVLESGKRLADNYLVTPIRVAGGTSYQKDPFYSANRAKILRLVGNPKAFAEWPRKTKQRVVSGPPVIVRLPVRRARTRIVTLDDIDSFSRVRDIPALDSPYTAMPEARFKKGVARILGEGGEFKDWGGEPNDLYTTRVRVRGMRAAAAFAFKGPGRKGKLTPAGMGKNADQVQRLFQAPASLFVVQYWGQVAQSVVEQLKLFATAKAALEGQEVLYGVIDGDDSNRLIAAYPAAFRPAKRRRRITRR